MGDDCSEMPEDEDGDQEGGIIDDEGMDGEDPGEGDEYGDENDQMED